MKRKTPSKKELEAAYDKIMGGKTLGERLIEGLQDIVQRMQNGDPINVTEVRREETPDGPLHTFKKKVWRKKPVFDFFYNGVFSQWHPSKFKIDGVEYTHCEQYMMAEKARLFGDTKTLKKIMKAKHPSEQKALGKEVTPFDKKTWNSKARDIVYRGNFAKFTQNEDFKDCLLNTVGQLAEASPTDEIWGIGLSADDPRAKSRKTWQGTNWLGEVLTQVREDIKNHVKRTEFNWSK